MTALGSALAVSASVNCLVFAGLGVMVYKRASSLFGMGCIRGERMYQRCTLLVPQP